MLFKGSFSQGGLKTSRNLYSTGYHLLCGGAGRAASAGPSLPVAVIAFHRARGAGLPGQGGGIVSRCCPSALLRTRVSAYSQQPTLTVGTWTILGPKEAFSSINTSVHLKVWHCTGHHGGCRVQTANTMCSSELTLKKLRTFIDSKVTCLYT